MPNAIIGEEQASAAAVRDRQYANNASPRLGRSDPLKYVDEREYSEHNEGESCGELKYVNPSPGEGH
jgi:hypothetical protein